MRRTIFLLAGLLIVPLGHAIPDYKRLEIIQRIQPVGQVNVEEEVAQTAEVKSAEPVTPAKKLEPGQATYEQYCVTCHRSGLAGAPKFRTAEWQAKISGKTVDDLVAIAIKGINAMPAKGTCTECSNNDIKQAIQYMLPR